MEIPNFHQLKNLQESKRMLNKQEKISNKNDIPLVAEEPETIEVEPDDKRKKQSKKHESENPPKESSVLIKGLLNLEHAKYVHTFIETRYIINLLST